MGLGQVLVAGALALDQIGHRVEPQPVDAHIEPEPHHRQHVAQHQRIVEVQVRLVRIEAVPEVRPGHGVPTPVGLLGVAEDDARAAVGLVGVGPDVVIARGRARLGMARALEPRMLVGGVVDHQLSDHAQPARMRGGDEAPHFGQRAVFRMDVAVVRDVVAVVAARRGIEGQQPDRVDAEADQVVELRQQTGEVADPVTIGVVERLDVQLIDDRVLVPQRIGVQQRGAAALGEALHADSSRLGLTCQRANGSACGSSRMR